MMKSMLETQPKVKQNIIIANNIRRNNRKFQDVASSGAHVEINVINSRINSKGSADLLLIDAILPIYSFSEFELFSFCILSTALYNWLFNLPAFDFYTWIFGGENGESMTNLIEMEIASSEIPDFLSSGI